MYSTIYTRKVLTQIHSLLFTITLQTSHDDCFFHPGDDFNWEKLNLYNTKTPKTETLKIYLFEKCTQIHKDRCFLSGKECKRCKDGGGSPRGFQRDHTKFKVEFMDRWRKSVAMATPYHNNWSKAGSFINMYIIVVFSFVFFWFYIQHIWKWVMKPWGERDTGIIGCRGRDGGASASSVARWSPGAGTHTQHKQAPQIYNLGPLSFIKPSHLGSFHSMSPLTSHCRPELF